MKHNIIIIMALLCLLSSSCRNIIQEETNNIQTTQKEEEKEKPIETQEIIETPTSEETKEEILPEEEIIPQEDHTETIAETEEAIEKPTIDEPIQEETITEEKTTQKVLLDVPQAVQENGYYCGPAILQMTLLWHNISSNQDDLAVKLNTSSITGTEYADMARALNSYLFGYEVPAAHEAGYRVQELTHGYISDEDIALLCERTMIDIDNGDPLPLAINLSSLYPEQPIANHFVLIVGYRTNEHGELTDFYIRDPYGKVQDATYQGLKIFTVSEIQEALKWNDEPAYIW